ncbi:hypothetical protein D9M71_643620 [compost metagenome]
MGRGLGRQIIDLVQSEQLPGQFQQCLALHTQASRRHVEQGIVGEHFAFQPAEREDSPVDTGTMGSRTGEQDFPKFAVAGRGFHHCPDPSRQVGIGHPELLGVLQSR